MVKFGKRGNERANDVLSGGEESVSGRRKASRRGAVVLAVTLFLVAFALVLAATFPFRSAFTVALAVVAGLALAGSVHIAYEWERAVVLRFGRFHRLAGPGLYVTVPVVDSVTIVIDQRISSISCSAEQVLTADLVPVDLDAVVFWMVWSAKSAAVEVEDYASAVSWIAQTAMRKAIGRATVAEVATRRDQLDEELKEAIEEKLNPWGITIIDVEIRDIVLPKELQEAMAQEAVAERKKNARMVLAEAEKDISEMLMDASEVYAGDADAMKLRTMHLAYESVEKSGGTLVVPSAFSEGFVEGGAEKAAREGHQA